MTLRRNRFASMAAVAAALLILFLVGCSSDDDSSPTEPDPEPLIAATLLRASGVGDGTQQLDEIVLWLAADAAAGYAALEVGGVATGTAVPADPDGVEFRIAPSFDVPLFTVGGVVEMELRDAAGDLAATALAEAPAANTVVLSPQPDEQVSPDGFAVDWNSDGRGTVTITLASQVDDTRWEIVAENDGHYEISANALAGFPKGRCDLQVVRTTTVLLTSVELGAGAMEQTLVGSVIVRLAS